MGPLEYAAAVIGLTIALCVAAVLVWRAAALQTERRRRERRRRAALVELMEQHSAIEEAYNMRTSSDIRREVMETLGEYADGYDVPAIMEELRGALEFDPRGGYPSIDTIEPAEYWTIVARHDMTAPGIGTTIRTDAGNVYTYTGPDGAPNWLDEVIAGTGEYIKDEYGAWHMDDAGAVWWIEWARREERIQTAMEDADDATAQRAREAYGADYETGQRAACDALGIEY